MMSSNNKQISFCISCRNRLWQLEQTLKFNLDQINDNLEIVLVDYGSTHPISSWIWSNFSKFIENKRLVFFEVKNDVNWSSPKAKNLAHRLANSSYLFNLDADNFIDTNDIQSIFIAKEKNLPCHQWSGSFGDGSFGRIGVPKELFYRIGGYDESLLPMGAQDLDLIKRIASLDIHFSRVSKPSHVSIKNSFADKIGEFTTISENHEEVYEEINRLNQIKALLRLKIEGPIIKGGFSTFQGVLNGKNVIIDGLGNIRPYAI